MEHIIEINKVSKKFQISHGDQKYVALRDIFGNIIKNPFSFIRRKTREIIGLEGQEIFWALEDINLSINKGEIVGIIGKNGAGKSTLLKVLSRITPPTTGEIKIRGRVGSLLEVGTGFHPELSGRENIFLNGAILGMSKKEIVNKFDEIVAFAGIEKFLDTPVKFYSSGMYVRLAFSVAAHMEPDILIVDEVLAVGDAEFQKKCLGKINEVSKKEGRTILFVSHNMNAIEQLCTRVILLDKGRLIKDSKNVEDVLREYVYGIGNSTMTVCEWKNTGKEYVNNYFIPKRMVVADNGQNVLGMPMKNNQDAWVQIEGDIINNDSSLIIGYAIYNEEGNLLYSTFQTDVPDNSQLILQKGRCLLRSKIPARILNEGSYRIELAVGLHNADWVNRPGHNSPAIYLSIQGGLSDSSFFIDKRPGIMAPILGWEYQKL